jgi:peptidyl-tRNA hydrolase
MLQAAHAAIDFQHQHPEISKIWNKNSNYLIFLSVENENKLTKYLEKFNHFNLKTTVFREPDIGNEITAIAVEPHELSLKICSSLPISGSLNTVVFKLK